MWYGDLHVQCQHYSCVGLMQVWRRETGISGSSASALGFTDYIRIKSETDPYKKSHAALWSSSYMKVKKPEANSSNVSKHARK